MFRHAPARRASSSVRRARTCAPASCVLASGPPAAAGRHRPARLARSCRRCASRAGRASRSWRPATSWSTLGEPLGPGQIVNSNAYALAAAVEEVGRQRRGHRHRARRSRAAARGLRVDARLRRRRSRPAASRSATSTSSSRSSTRSVSSAVLEGGAEAGQAAHLRRARAASSSACRAIRCRRWSASYLYVAPALRRAIGLRRGVRAERAGVEIEQSVRTARGLSEFVRCTLRQRRRTAARVADRHAELGRAALAVARRLPGDQPARTQGELDRIGCDAPTGSSLRRRRVSDGPVRATPPASARARRSRSRRRLLRWSRRRASPGASSASAPPASSSSTISSNSGPPCRRPTSLPMRRIQRATLLGSLSSRSASCDGSLSASRRLSSERGDGEARQQAVERAVAAAVADRLGHLARAQGQHLDAAPAGRAAVLVDRHRSTGYLTGLLPKPWSA